MIISASRRTDIPNYFSDWFLNRINEKAVFVRNPMNRHQVSRIDLSPEKVDCIVFWTKNPSNMIEKLDHLRDYKYYFQFTMNAYGKEIEPNVPSKGKELIDVFRKLSDKIGPEKVIWRYDPIFLNDKYSMAYHVEYFEKLASKLRGYTEQCTFSFIDPYPKKLNRLKVFEMNVPNEEEQLQLAIEIGKIGKAHNMAIKTCAEKLSLIDYGILHGSCIDKRLISKMIGADVSVEKDKNQREACGCVSSVDIGLYSTCMNSCQYCYANHSDVTVTKNYAKYDVNAPMLCSDITADDKVTDRQVKSVRVNQISFDDRL